MIIKKSIGIWDHIPSIDELRELTDPDKDLTATMFDDNADISKYLEYTGLRIFTDGRSSFKSEMKYIIKNGKKILPAYHIPLKEQFLLI